MCNFDEHLLKICTVANSPQGFAGYAKYPIAPIWTCRCLEFDLSSLLYCWITCPRLYVPYPIKTHTNRYDVSEEKGYKWIDGRPRIHHGKFNLSNLRRPGETRGCSRKFASALYLFWTRVAAKRKQQLETQQKVTDADVENAVLYWTHLQCGHGHSSLDKNKSEKIYIILTNP